MTQRHCSSRRWHLPSRLVHCHGDCVQPTISQSSGTPAREMDEARHLLLPIYNRFSEGFGTRDLVVAAALIG